MGFDIIELDTKTLGDQGLPMPLLHLRTREPIIDDEGMPVTITLYGRQSDIFRDTMKQIQEERAAYVLRHNRQPDSEYSDAEDCRLLVACTKDWTFKQLAGEDFPCTPGNVRRFWSDDRFRPLRTLALTFVTNDANFLPPAKGVYGDTPGSNSSPAVLSLQVARSQIPSAAIA